MKILITGGCGFIGTNIALEARNRGYDVVAFDSFIRPGTEGNIGVLKEAGVTLFRGDVRSYEDLKRVGSVDAIIHLAANPGIPWSIQWPKYDFDVNVVGTINVLELAREQSIPVIFASTNKVYSDLINETQIKEYESRYYWPRQAFMDGISIDGINESFPIDAFGRFSHSPYGVSKLSGDLYCQEYFQAFGVKTVVNRMSCIYGLYQQGVEDQGWIDHFVRTIGFGDGKINLYGNGKQVRDMLWGEDVANLYLCELENIDRVAGKVFNVGGGVSNTLSLNEAISEIERVSGKKATIEYHDWRHADQKIYISDIGHVRSILPWKPEVNPRQGIFKMHEFYKGL